MPAAIQQRAGHIVRYLMKIAGDLEIHVLLGIIVGIIGGTMGVVFTLAVEYTYDNIAGRIINEKLVTTSIQSPGALLIVPVMVSIGGLISGIVTKIAGSQVEGHGTDYVIDAIHRKRARLPAKIAFWKLLASTFFIGTGGSAGKEGPIALAGAGVASWVAQKLRLGDFQRRALVLSGVAAGISAVFKAPLGALMFALEVPYKRDVEVEYITPIAVASFTGYTISSIILGPLPIISFRKPIPGGIDFPWLAVIVLGVVMGLAARAYVRVFYAIREFLFRTISNPIVRPAIGGLIAGVIAVVIPASAGQGYWIVNEIMQESIVYAPLTLVIAGIGKIMATSFGVGSGGSGGVFAPSLVAGALLAAGITSMLSHSYVAALTLIGMASFFAAASKTPLATTIMVAEMSGGYSMIPATILAVSIAYVVSGSDSIYASQVDTRLDSPFYLGMEARELFKKFVVRQVMSKPIAVFEWQTLREALQAMINSGLSGVPVVDEGGRLLGVVMDTDIIRHADSIDMVRVGDVMERGFPYVEPEDSVDHAIGLMISYNVEWLPVVESRSSMKLEGIIVYRDILRIYRVVDIGVD